MRVFGGYLASVAAAVTALLLAGAAVALFEAFPPPAAEPAFPSGWISVALTFVLLTLLVTVSAMPAFLLCLAVSMRMGWRHLAVHVVYGGAIGLVLGHLFAGMVDRPQQAAGAAGVSGCVY